MRIKLSNNKERFCQWDTGQYISLDSCPDSTEVYLVWSGSEADKADKLVISDKKAQIPDEVLQTAGTIKVIIRYLDDTTEWTQQTMVINVSAQEEPDGYIASETQFADYISRAELYIDNKLTSYRTITEQDEIDKSKADADDVYSKDEVYTKDESDAKYITEHQSLAEYRKASAQDAIDSTKVDKVSGKGLSTNDFTTEEKTKVDAIPENPKYTDTTYTAGNNVQISDDHVISATDTIYDDTEIKADVTQLSEDLADKADADSVYTKTETDDLLDDKLSKPSTFEVGQLFRIASLDSEGNPVLEAISQKSVVDEILCSTSTSEALTDTEKANACSRLGTSLIQKLTQEEYDLIETPDENTVYIIVEEDES